MILKKNIPHQGRVFFDYFQQMQAHITKYGVGPGFNEGLNAGFGGALLRKDVLYPETVAFMKKIVSYKELS